MYWLLFGGMVVVGLGIVLLFIVEIGKRLESAQEKKAGGKKRSGAGVSRIEKYALGLSKSSETMRGKSPSSKAGSPTAEKGE